MDPGRVDTGAGRLWAARARFEAEAALRFDRLARDLTALDSPLADLAWRAADDERRHRVQCAELATSFGRAVDPTSPEPEPETVAPAGLTTRQRVLYDAVALCAVMETVSTALLGEMLRRTEHPAARATVHAILRDEVDHARIGWGHLAWEAARGDVGFLGRWLPTMLRGTVEDELFEEAEHGSRTEPFGGLRRSARRSGVEAAVCDVIAPGLAAHGVDPKAGVAWLEGRLSRQRALRRGPGGPSGAGPRR